MDWPRPGALPAAPAQAGGTRPCEKTIRGRPAFPGFPGAARRSRRLLASRYDPALTGEAAMLVLYHHNISVCAQKVRLALAEKRLAHERRHVSR